MGLFDIFKKKKLTEAQEQFLSSMGQAYEYLKSKCGFQGGWTNINSSCPKFSLNNPHGGPESLCITFEVSALPKIEENSGIAGRSELLVDVSREGEVHWIRIKQLLSREKETIPFFNCSFSFAELAERPLSQGLPLVEEHGAGVSGFWLRLPLDDLHAWSKPEFFSPLIKHCIDFGRKIS